ncbi:MAG TPA: glycosyltransferase family 4 protein [Bryobacteraceae bacterium]|nr:glycosyltransferase family 4 protein [Bryobacteraceae bacterium]
MRILALTAGAANMYCGSCLRDNALAAELMSQGHDVALMPLYTPTLTDEVNVSSKRVLFGGISVYLEQHLAPFRFTPAWLDRLWDSLPALKAASRRSIAVSPRHLGELTISMLRGEHGAQRKEFQKLVDWLRGQPKPDVVSIPNSLLISLARPIREALGCPVACTLQGEDLFLEGLGEPWRSQALDLIRAQIDSVDAFIAVSEYYAGFMSRYLGIPESKMHVVPIGINLKGYDTGFRFRTNCFTVGYFARVVPEKGLHVLAEAYRKLRRETEFSGATLEAAGYLAPEYRGYLHGIEQEMKKAGLSDEFRYRGVLDRVHKVDFLRSLSMLSVPGLYAEPKGIFVLEAMANEVPVVQPRHGAFPEIIQKTGGGILVEPNSVDSLAEGILSLWRDQAHADELGRRGAQGVREHHGVALMAQRAVETYSKLQRQTVATH